MSPGGFKIFVNKVKSLPKAPYLILVCPEHATGWCHQYAQEGYNVLHIQYSDALDQRKLEEAREYLSQQTNAFFGLIIFGLSSNDANVLTRFCGTCPLLRVVVHYCPLAEKGGLFISVEEAQVSRLKHLFHLASSQETLHASLLTHSAGQASLLSGAPAVAVHTYPLVPSSPAFPLLSRAPATIVPGDKFTVDPHVLSASNIAYSKTLALLRSEIGPRFDLEKIWGEHIRYEFAERNALKTMETMVDVPYVNHIPTMTGGVGKDDLTRFYKYHFTSVSVTPPDTEIITVSRTIGSDRIIDEMIFKATHTCEIDYVLPGVKPTGKPFEIALVGIIAFRGDKLCFEHIYWDQASLLVQLGLLPTDRLPVAGKETAQKVLDPYGMASNTLLGRWKDSEGLSVEE